MSAAADPAHAALMRRFEPSLKDEPISKKRLVSLHPLSTALLPDGPPFEGAVYGVQSKLECRIFNDLTIMRFGQQTRLAIFARFAKERVSDKTYCAEKAVDLYESGVDELRCLFVVRGVCCHHRTSGS